MRQLRKLFRGHPHPNRMKHTRLRLEELENRTVPTTASFNVAVSIANSTEHFQDIVTNDYTALLHRFPDTAGLNGWVAALASGLSREQVDANFAGSAEYVAAKGGIGQGWIEALYQDFLHRAADPAGLTFWTTAITSFSPVTIALSFTQNAERDSAMITADYAFILSRPPDPAGLAYWQSQFQAGRVTLNSLETQLVGSQEFYVRTGNTNQTFIMGAYQAILKRPPTQSELDSWLSVMAIR